MSQAARDALPHLALPLAELLVRALNAKSALERHQGVFYLGEAAIRLLAAAAVAAWLRSGPAPGDPGWVRVEALPRPSLGHWLAWIRAVREELDPAALRFAAVPTAAAERWADALVERSVFDGGATRPLRRQGPLAFFELLGRYRNDVVGHGAQRVRAFYEDTTPLLLDAVLEQLAAVPWLWRGALVAEPDEPDGSWRRLAGLAALPTDPADATGIAALTDDGPLPLGPWIVPGRDRALDRDRVLFLNRVLVRGRAVRRVEYLDYATGETVEVAASALAVGAVLAGAPEAPPDEPTGSVERVDDYALGEVLGQGAMGVVRAAVQVSLGRPVALKTLAATLASDAVARARFDREVRALARCDHPNVVKVLAAGVSGELPYYAMERIDGADLGRVAQRLSGRDVTRLTTADLRDAVSAAADGSGSTGGPAEPLVPHLVRLFAGAAEGLAHLHARGVVHRDVKPGNLMLTADAQRLVVMDLGLARLSDASRGLTQADDRALGTLRYMPAEQLETNADAVDGRADVYALAATLYELLAGRPFHDGDSRERLVHQILTARPPPLDAARPGLPPGLGDAVSRATERDRDRRTPSAQAFAEDLHAIAAGRKPAFGALAAPRPPRSRARTLGLAALGLGGLAAAACAGLWAYPDPFVAWAFRVDPPRYAMSAKEVKIDGSYPSLAADGHTYAFVRDSDLWLADLDQPDVPPRNLTADFAQHLYEAKISPDGTEVLFGSGDAIYVLGTAEGSTPKIEVDRGFPGYWAGNGERFSWFRGSTFTRDGDGSASMALLHERASGADTPIPGKISSEARFARRNRSLVAASGGSLSLRSGEGATEEIVLTGAQGEPAGFTPDDAGIVLVDATPEDLRVRVAPVPWWARLGDHVHVNQDTDVPVVELGTFPGQWDDDVFVTPGASRFFLGTAEHQRAFELLRFDEGLTEVVERRLLAVPDGTLAASLLANGADVLIARLGGLDPERGPYLDVTILPIERAAMPPDEPTYTVYVSDADEAGSRDDPDHAWQVFDGEVVDFDARTGATRPLLRLPPNLHSVAVSRDGERIAITDADIRVLVVPTEAPDLTAAMVAARRDGFPGKEVVDWLPDGTGLLVMDNRDGALEVVTLATREIRRLPVKGDQVEWVDRDTILVSSNGKVVALDLAVGAEPRTLVAEDVDGAVNGVSADGRTALVMLDHEIVHQWLVEITPAP